MLKYLKWELKNYFNHKYLWFIFIAVIYLLIAIIPKDSNGFISGLILILYTIVVVVSLGGSFILGTKKVIDTFSKKTFLLESMIPYSAKKLLLCKYLLGIIINLLFSIIGIIGLSIIIVKGVNFEFLMNLIKYFIDQISLIDFLRFSFTLILSTVTFMSFIVFGYIVGKVIRPGGKGSKFVGVIIWIILFYTFAWFMRNVNSNNIELISDITYIVTSTILFFITSWLIENKLEIYN